MGPLDRDRESDAEGLRVGAMSLPVGQSPGGTFDRSMELFRV